MKAFILLIIVLSMTIPYGSAEQEKPRASATPQRENAGVRPRLPGEIRTINDDAPMVLIPAGAFIYGISKTTKDSILKTLSTAKLPIFELELRKQTKFLPSYYIDKFEITNQQYAKFLEETDYPREPRYWLNRLYNQPNQPVVGVTWPDAEAYAKWAGKRLPSEEEWEKAARGTDGRIWPWGNKPTGKNYNGRVSGNLMPVAVGSYPRGASPYGVMDMAGNVYEMTTGYWGEGGKAIRGGSYLNGGAYTRTTFRWATSEERNGVEYLGFRCVMDTTMIATHTIVTGK